jgi:uncharacterized protein
MRYDDLRASSDVEDRRVIGGATKGGLGIGAILILALVGYATGIEPGDLIGGAELIDWWERASGFDPCTRRRAGRPDRQVCRQGTRRDRGRLEPGASTAHGRAVPEADPRVVPGMTQSACGTTQSAKGAFYCPLDGKVYLDSAFFHDMERRFGGGAFPDACVIAHEVGHHVQNLIGLLPKVQRAAAQSDQRTRRSKRPVGAHRADGRLSRERVGVSYESASCQRR